MRATKGGFTLLEIIVVVVLISLLASYTGVRIVQQGDRAKVKLAGTMVKSGAIPQALDRFYLDNGFYPTTHQGLEALVEKPSGTSDLPDYDEEGYLDEIVLDPWNMSYRYEYPGTNKPRRYDLWSVGRDRKSGTADDIGNWRKK